MCVSRSVCWLREREREREKEYVCVFECPSFYPFTFHPCIYNLQTKLVTQTGLTSNEASCQFHQHFLHAFFVRNFCRQNSKPKSQLCSFWRQKFIQKMCAKNDDEIDKRKRNPLKRELLLNYSTAHHSWTSLLHNMIIFNLLLFLFCMQTAGIK